VQQPSGSHSAVTPVRNPAPERLPPLIEKLVGFRDPAGLDGTKPAKNADVLVVNLNKKNENGDSRMARPMGSTDDSSIAAVAAAAAAAIFSQHDRYRRGHGRLRMKSYNEQSEAALRWVASWDDASFQSLNQTPLPNDRSSSWKKPSSSSTRRKKKVKPSTSFTSTDSPPASARTAHHNRTHSDWLYETCL